MHTCIISPKKPNTHSMSEQQPKRKSSSSNHWKVCYDLWRLRPIETEESSTSRASCVRIGEKISLAGRRFRKFTMALDTDIVKDDRIHFRWKHQCCRRAALNSALHILFQKRWTRREKRARDSRPECRISSSNSIFRAPHANGWNGNFSPQHNSEQQQLTTADIWTTERSFFLFYF